MRHSSDVDAAADAGGAPAVSAAGEDVGLLRSLFERTRGDRVLGAALWASMNGLYGQRALRKPRTLQAVRSLRRAPSIRDKAAALRRTLFGDRPYLCAHVRRVENAQRWPGTGAASGRPRCRARP